MKTLSEFELPKEQSQFTALPKNVLSELKNGQFPIVIECEGVPVGFFLLHSTERVKEYTDNPNALLLTALSIDHRQQRKGYAKNGMLTLPSFVRGEFGFCNEVILAVNHKNIPAQRLYSSVGFIDTGKRKVGPIGEQVIMSLQI